MAIFKGFARAGLLTLMATFVWAVEIEIPKNDGPNPWTNLDFNNDPSNFHFAVVSDNGRPAARVFEKAVEKLNLMQPAFVLCIGDLVEGNAPDAAALNAQWDEFEHILAPLRAPFFFVPGNHDVSNTNFGAEVWRARHGRLYYHFIYDRVLFLCMNSDDGGLERIGDEQYEYVRKTLEENPDVSWIFAFMHKPLWNRDGAQGWDRVETLLANRPHTVFTGHTHEYLKYDRHGRDYFVLATTGGGMAHHGPISGEFDGFTWVTMEPDGPAYANLVLDGILDKDARDERKAALAGPVLDGYAVTAAPLMAAQPFIEAGEIDFQLANPADIPLRARGVIVPSVQWQPDHTVVERTIPAGGKATARLTLKAPWPLDIRIVQPVVAHWTFSYALDGGASYDVPYTQRIVVDGPYTCMKADRPIQVDGNLGEWGELPFIVTEPAEANPDTRTWEGPGDGSFQFSVLHDENRLYFGVRIIDDRMEFGAKEKSKRRDFITLRVSAQRKADGPAGQAGAKNSGLELVVGPGATASEPYSPKATDLPDGVALGATAREDGYDVEAAIPASLLSVGRNGSWESIRVNIGLTDFDSPVDTGATLWWRPELDARGETKATGCFTRE